MRNLNAASTEPGVPATRHGLGKFSLPFLAIAALFLTLVAYQIYASKQTARSAATTNAKNLALILESKLNSDFAAAERMVSAMVSEIDPDAMRPELAGRYRPQIAARLKARVGDIPSASALRYFDANGNRLYASTDDEPPLNIADRPHFRKLRADPTGPTIFSEVTLGRASKRISLYVAKPVLGKDGTFLGAATTTIDLTSLHQHFRSIEIGKESVLALRRLDDGAAIVRFPGPVKVDNKPAPDLPVRKAILEGSPAGVMDIVSRVDGIQRLYGYRRIGAFPLFVAVGIADGDYLAEWRRESASLLAGSILFVASLAAVFFWLAVAESQRNRSEIRLRESEDRFRHLAEISADWYWEQDENCRFSYVSSGFTGLIAPQDQVLGRTRWEVPHLDTDPRVMREHDALLAARKPFKDLLIKRTGSDGLAHYLQLSGDPVFGEQGQFRGYRGVGSDITERMRKEEQITGLMLEQKAILDSHVIGIVKLRERKVTWVNDAFAEMLGYTSEEMIGQSTRFAYPSDQAFEEFEHSTYPVLRRGGIFRAEAQYIRKDGTLGWYQIGGGLLSPGSDESIWSFIDITERKRAENALKSSEDKFRKAFYLNPDAININRLEDGQYVSINGGFTEIMGYTESEIIGDASLPFRIWDNPEDRARLVQGLKKDGKVANLEACFRAKDGGIRHGLLSAAVIDIDGVPHMISITRDITERRKADEARVQLEAQLREAQKMEALGTLAGGVAHDFNNIVAAILGNVELARQDAGSAHAVLESLEEIRKAGLRAKALVQQILSFGRRQLIERRVISLAPVVEETEGLLRATLPAGVSLTTECEPDAPLVLADATQIEQVLINLCSNAWQSIQSRARPGSIVIRLQAHQRGTVRPQAAGLALAYGDMPPGRYACLAVQDNGSGMDQETMARIFEPFFTTKPIGKGTGLGLAVVHGIVQEHGASIEVFSVPGEGSTFRVYFPEAQAAAEHASARLANTAPARGQGKHVLYVDDDEAVVFLMTRLLEKQGYRVSGYTDAPAALAAARADPAQFDLAVTDHNMPGMSGLDLARELRAIRADLPVAMATGYITEELRQLAPAAGVSELIYKPNTVEDFCEVVAHLATAQGRQDKPSNRGPAGPSA